jgi:hypothetical protein
MPEATDLTTAARTGAWLRRRWWLGAATLLGGTGCSPWAPGLSTPGSARDQVVPFSTSDRLGGLPEGWQPHVTRPDLPFTRYGLAQRDGRTVMHAQADSSTSGLRCDLDLDPNRTPWLSWEWRVDDCPLGATVAEDALDDAPARIVLGFDGDSARLSLRERLFADQVELFTGHTLPFATLTYVWDGRASVESVFPYARSSRIRYLVVDSGAAGIGRWLGHRRHVVEDYRRVFGEPPGRILGVGVLTDSDDLKIRAEAWFGDLAFT